MKRNLRLTCLFFLIFFLFTVGFVHFASADDDKGSLIIDNNTWGYEGREYCFNVTLVPPKNFSNDAESRTNVSIKHWISGNNTPKLNDTIPLTDFKKVGNIYTKQINLTISEKGSYSIFANISENNTYNISNYWTTVRIISCKCPEPKSVFMWDEIKGLDADKTESSHYYNHTLNFMWDKEKFDGIKEYCGYENTYYAFSANFTEDNLNSEVLNKKIKAEFNWSDKSKNDSTDRKYIYDNELHNFTHEWDETGNKTIKVRGNFRDPYDEDNDLFSTESKDISILIIRDPKSFVLLSNPYETGSNMWVFCNIVISIIEPFTNLQNLGILLAIIGLIILIFVFTKNEVPVKISLFGLKPFYLKSVDYFTGLFTFVAGMYFYFVFGRCPWDIPIIGISQNLQDAYFSMLYYEYESHTIGNNTEAIPYLSILLGLVVITSLSTILYRVGVPFLNPIKECEILNKIRNFYASIKLYRVGVPFLNQVKECEILNKIKNFYASIKLHPGFIHFKEFSIQIKENIGRIKVTNGKVTGLQSKSGKKENM